MENPSPELQAEKQEAEKPYELPSDDALLALALVREEFGPESEEYNEAFYDLQFETAKVNYPEEVASALSDMRGTGNLSEAKLDKQDKARTTIAKLYEEAAIKIIAALEALE